MLQSYTLEELAYEYFDKHEREEYAKQQEEEIVQHQEEEKHDEALKWAEEEEEKERNTANMESPETEVKSPISPPLATQLTPEDIKWMQDQLAEDKKHFGNSFGEDIIEEF